MALTTPGRRLALALTAAMVVGWVVTLVAPLSLAEAAAWPFGAVTGCALWCRRPGRVLVLVGLVVSMFASFVVRGVPLDTAAGVALAQGVGSAVTVLALTRLGRVQPTLLSEPDIGRYVAGATCGGLGVMAVATGWWLAGDADFKLVVVGLGSQHLASELLLLPFFMRQHPHGPAARWPKRALQWGLTLGVTAALFSDPRSPAAGFLVLAALSWGARRLGTWEILWQTVVVATTATSLTLHDRGPFGLDGTRMAEWARSADAFLLEAFVACAALVVVPLVLTVGVQLDSVRQASRERDRIAGIVDGARALAIVGTDVDGSINLFNVGAERLLGYRAEEVLGRSSVMLHPHGELERQAASLGVAPTFGAVARALGRQEAQVHEMRVLRQDGEVRTHAGMVHTVVDDDGSVSGFVAIREDVSERILEQQSLEAAIERLREIDEAKDRFVSSISHELRTPLASIIGYLEMLVEGAYGPLTTRQVEAISRMEANGGRLLSLIDDLLTFSRLGDDASWVAREPIELRDVVRGAVEVVEPTLRHRDLTVDLHVPARPVDVVGDRGLLERLVINIVNNAVKFTPDGGRVDVRVRPTDDWAVIEVSDTGMGIPADELPQLSSRFFRSRRAHREAVPGTGLGLSIARSVAENHGGCLDIHSVEGEGTSVVISLPLARNVEHSTTVVPV